MRKSQDAMNNIFADAINEYGVIPQLIKAAEELSECSAAISKYVHLRMIGEPVTPNEVMKELGDVEIVSKYLGIIFVEHLDIKDISKKKKLLRLTSAIKERHKRYDGEFPEIDGD